MMKDIFCILAVYLMFILSKRLIGGQLVSSSKYELNLNNVRSNETCRKCECSIKKGAMMVDCSKRSIAQLPKFLPINTKVVNLTENRISSLNVSNLGKDGWKNVIYLYLSNNSMKTIEGIDLLENLVHLDVRRNMLEEIPIHLLQHLHRIDTILIGDNPWACDCNTIPFKKWLQENFKKVKDINSVKCVQYLSTADRNMVHLPIYRIPISGLCPLSNNPIHYLDVVIGLLAFLSLIVLLKLYYDWYWQKKTGKLPKFFKINV